MTLTFKDGEPCVFANREETAVLEAAIARGPNAQGIYNFDDWFYGEMARIDQSKLAALN